MEQDCYITKVVFRKWRGEIIALFPYEFTDQIGFFCSSYMHVGQHGCADYTSIVNRSKPALPSEYESLRHELTNLGYNLLVIQKINMKEWYEERKKYKEQLASL